MIQGVFFAVTEFFADFYNKISKFYNTFKWSVFSINNTTTSKSYLDLSEANSPSIQNQNAISLKRKVFSGCSTNWLSPKVKHDRRAAARARIELNETAESGKSMIEMLGVLAIIAVLSVGGIAGYSKAMQMYKLNKWKNDFIYMMTNIKASYLNSKTYSDKQESILELIKELEIVPKNMLTANNIDIFGNKLYVSVAPMTVNWGVPLRFAIRLETIPNKDSVEQCKILFSFLNYFDDAWIVALNENTGKNRHYVCGKASTKYYSTHIGCKPYNWSEISQKCSVCSKQVCDIKFILENN